ncbi:MAG: hypothetical protein A3F92_00750 [Candidatus Rokubacteria bacterium RIFCSPLOWO2_12_FULL_71_22]|nr:MAG: hypothetical protein A3F92_00750 [Candidatus Rokubacteria bacterium RIFCSPLOWO2_12_FULL_71_22]
MLRRLALSGLVLSVCSAGAAWGGPADVVAVQATRERDDVWTFSVTVRHDDRDPDHWADWWRVRTADGRELGRRVLLHSHVDEQPFTRDARIRVPRDVRIVFVEAHDRVHGLGGAAVRVDLATKEGPGYRVRPRP